MKPWILSIAGVLACTPNGSIGQTKTPTTKSGITVTDTALNVTCTNARLAKPPLRTFECEITLQAPVKAGWVILPTYLETPIKPAMNLTQVEVIRTAQGQVYFRAYGEPGFIAFQVAAGSDFHLQTSMSAFASVTDGQVWLTENVAIGAKSDLRSLLAGPLKYDDDGLLTPALLASWSAPSGTVVKITPKYVSRFKVPNQ